MPKKNDLGQIRRSQVLSYGPGAIIDFRSPFGGGTVSFISAGLEFWNESYEERFPETHQKIFERRLEKRHGVEGFRLPPVDDRESNKLSPKTAWLTGIRFPTWLQCPKCERLKLANKWGIKPGDSFHYCQSCSNNEKKIYVVPARFLLACEKGHIDDFPWQWWLDTFGQKNKKCADRCELYLKSFGSTGLGLSGLYLICGKKECGNRASMAGIFTEGVLSGFHCDGKKVWLGRDQHEKCEGGTLRTVQRGSSNLYFPVTDSALSIPPWSDRIHDVLHTNWHRLLETKDPQKRRMALEVVVTSEQLNALDMSIDELSNELDKQFSNIEEETQQDLRPEEYKNLRRNSRKSSEDFEVRQLDVPDKLTPYFSRIGKVVRLREVRVLFGFKRIHEPSPTDTADKDNLAPISRTKQKWLPAIEVKGEGIYLELNHETCSKWENHSEIKKRADQINTKFQEDFRQNKNTEETETSTEQITPRFLLIHTFAHILMRQLALSCGYDTASLRERLYVSKEENMLGLLIYTGASDSDGTLGGLSRQADPDLLQDIITEAINAVLWCSSDPLCLSGTINASQPLNLAACHACVLVPETSCERYNKLLDRVMVVGDTEKKIPGFFESMLE